MVYIGDKGIAYSEHISHVESGGPFVDIVADFPEGTTKVIAMRGNGTPNALTHDGNSFRATLSGVSDYEPISVTGYGSGGVKLATIDFDCMYRAAKSGAVIYNVRP